jgi:hypothetical protein
MEHRKMEIEFFMQKKKDKEKENSARVEREYSHTAFIPIEFYD